VTKDGHSRCQQAEARIQAKDYLKGLLSLAERMNGWWLAEILGDTSPYGIQVRNVAFSRSISTFRNDAFDFVNPPPRYLLILPTSFIS
jgi:hypothetical protein